jgi:nucleoside-triphosphatase
MRKRLLFLTGNPGIGKTTVLMKTVEVLKSKGLTIGGMVSREVRSHGERVGFEVLDIGTNRRGWLARVDHNQNQRPRVGKYRVNLDDLNNVGTAALLKSVEDFDVVAIDEVGPMESCSTQFLEAVEKAVESDKIVIGTIHRKMRNELIDKIRAREDAEIFVVTYENRDGLHEIIARRAEEFLEKNTRE